MNLEFRRKLPIPKEIKEMLPVSEELAAIKQKRDDEIRDVFSGKSKKFLLVIGPCSADYGETVLSYIEKLKKIYDEVSDKIIIIPRVYTNKPRTKTDGYMGMLHQPDPKECPDLLKGIMNIRDVHLSALKYFGFTCADELLYPDNHRYLSDLLSYVAVGARSVEDQYHRLVASGLNIPVGMKNPVYGGLEAMMNGVTSARKSHAFLYRGWEVVSKGNNLSHAVLRGFVDENGNSVPNYGEDYIKKVIDLFGQNLISPMILVDCNHCNSGKDYLKQIDVAKCVMESRRKNKDIENAVKGLMIESYIYDGNQPIDGNIKGKSITDPCLGWEKTEKLIYEIAEKV